MSERAAPARIWATVNGMSTRLPDGKRQFIGGWSEDPSRDRVTEYVRADIAEGLRASLEEISTMFMARPDMVKAIQPLVGFGEKATFDRASAAIAKAEGRS